MGLKEVRDRLWNSERFIIFQTVILQQAQHVTASQAIRWRVGKRLDAWEDGKHSMLVEDRLRSCGEYLTVARREETTEHLSQTYHRLVLRGKLRMAVRCITKWETGGVLQPGDRCTKTGDQVMDVLRVKHPEARTPTAASLDSYSDRPPGAHSGGHHRGYGDSGCGETLGRGRTGQDRLGVPSSPDPAVRCCKWGAFG